MFMEWQTQNSENLSSSQHDQEIQCNPNQNSVGINKAILSLYNFQNNQQVVKKEKSLRTDPPASKLTIKLQ